MKQICTRFLVLILLCDLVSSDYVCIKRFAAAAVVVGGDEELAFLGEKSTVHIKVQHFSFLKT